MINLMKELFHIKDINDPELIKIIFDAEDKNQEIGILLLILHTKMMELHNKETVKILKEYNG